MSASYAVRCTPPGCGWTGTRTGNGPAAVNYPCPQCGQRQPQGQSTVIVDHVISTGGAA